VGLKGMILMFLVLLTYKKSLEEVDYFLDEHVKFLDKYYERKKFIFSGRRHPRTGGVILANVITEQEIQAIIQEDPFHFHGIADYQVIEFLPTKFDDRFKIFINHREQT
jgi:uncharacterized protein YciI